MIVLSEKTLRAAGVDYDTAVALVGKKEGELVVHIMDWHDPAALAAPPEPVDWPADPGYRRPPEGVSLRGIAAAPDSESDAHVVSTPSRRAALPMSADAVDAERERYRQTGQAVPNVLGLPRLGRGSTLNDARAVARALRAELEALADGSFRLSSPFGEATYPDLMAAFAALNSRSFVAPGDTHG